MEMKPFHESIVSIIRGAKTKEELKLIEKILLTTKSPKDQDVIAKAFSSKAKKLEMSDTKVLAALQQ